MVWLHALIFTAVLPVVLIVGGDFKNDSKEETQISPCDSPIYCDGPILEAVQTSGIFKDSKTFVDMPMKVDPDKVTKAFSEIRTRDTESIKQFVDDYFEEAGSDTEFVTPEDWIERPAFVERIKDQKLQEWALELNTIWKNIFKKTKIAVEQYPQRHTLLSLPHPFVIPGGRFREIYYWDTYWVNKGLLLCNMTQSVKGILLNYVSLINRFGLIPNGARIYFTRRSQLPLFAAMVDDYVEHTGDKDILRAVVPALEKEYDFWMENRNITVWKEGRSYTLQRYRSVVTKPRPESYKEDLKTASKSSSVRGELYGELQAGCESGWDFSGRWFSRDGPNNMTVSSARTSQIVPVDLNSVMFAVESSLTNFNRILGNKERVTYFVQQKADRLKAIESVLWDQTTGVWFDFDLELNQSNPHFYSSAGFPIYAGCHGSSSSKKQQRERAFMSYLRSSGALGYPGGIPTSLYATGEQWDFPNAWPPLVHVIIMGLAKSAIESVQEAARNLAQQWINTNYLAWKKRGYMFEKYDVETGSGPGSGGEYDVQIGFGWTNGVILDLLNRFGDVLTLDDVLRDVQSSTEGQTSSDLSTNSENKQKTKEKKTAGKRKKIETTEPDARGDKSQNNWDYSMIVTFLVIILSFLFVFISFAV